MGYHKKRGGVDRNANFMMKCELVFGFEKRKVRVIRGLTFMVMACGTNSDSCYFGFYYFVDVKSGNDDVLV